MIIEPEILANLDVGKTHFVHLLHFEDLRIFTVRVSGKVDSSWSIDNFGSQAFIGAIQRFKEKVIELLRTVSR